MFKIVTNSFSRTTLSLFICSFALSAENIEDNQSLSEVYKAIVRIEVISEKRFRRSNDEIQIYRKWSNHQ